MTSIASIGFFLVTVGLLVWNLTLRTAAKKRAAELAGSEGALRESTARFDALAASARFILLRVTRDGRILFLNAFAQRFFGYSAEEIVGRNLVGTIVPPDLPGKRFWQVIAESDALPADGALLEEENMRRDGSRVWVAWTGKALSGPEGKVSEILCVGSDSTAGRQAEERLAAANELLTRFIRHAPLCAFIKEASPTESRILQASDACQAIFGMPVTEMLGKTTEELLPAECAAKTAADDWQVVSRQEPLRLEEECRGRTYATTRFPIRLGERSLLAGYAIDITEHRQAQAALRASEAAFRSIVRATPMGMHVFDLQPDGHLTFVSANPAADKLLGLDSARLTGKTLEEIFPAIRDTELPRYFRRAAEFGETWQAKQFEYVDEAVRGVFNLYVFQMSPGRVAVLFNEASAGKRVEEEKSKLETQLTQVRKLESIGRLAGGVAHDFNNMLVVILGHCDLALSGLDVSHPLHAGLQSIRQAAARSADLTRQLLAFARRQPAAPKVLNLNETVAGMLTMLQRLIGENISLAWMPGRNIGQVRIDPSQLDQILVNLFANARDAIGDTGKVTVETAALILSEQYCAEHADTMPGDYVLLAVSDNGIGMDAKMLSQLFEPFYTTKKPGRGTGLGLATVYGIVKQNNGFVNVYSEPGQGSTFKVYLPRYTSSTDQELTEAVSPVALGSETVLLVEDEPMILEVTMGMLRKLGYTVLVASSPEEAIRLAHTHEGAIHLLLTDVVMPGMNGRMLANNLVTFNPALKCLFMSGYTANVIVHHGVLDEGVHFLQKPFTLDALAAKIRETMDD